MGILVDSTGTERSSVGVKPYRLVARGLLDMTAGGGAGAWIGVHTGFTDTITDNGVGDQTVHLVLAGAATMFARVVPRDLTAAAANQGAAAALAGATLQDLQVFGKTLVGADSNPGGAGGWNAGAAAVLGAPVAADIVMWIEVYDLA